MRILLITHHYDPETRPPQLRWSALVRDLVAAGHTVHVVTPAPHYPLGRLLPGEDPAQIGRCHRGRHGETVHRVRFHPNTGSALSSLLDHLLASAHTVVTVWRSRAEIAPDVVIGTVPALPTAFVGHLLSLLLRRPVVLEMRDAWPDLLESWPDLLDCARPVRLPAVRRGARRVVITLAHLALGRAQRSADLVVTTTDRHAAVLSSRGVRDVLTIRNAHHDLGAPITPREAPPRSTSRDPDAPGAGVPLHILYAGTLGRAQGLETAVRALAQTRRAGVDASLRIVGAGVREHPLRELATELNVPVTFVSQIPRAHLAEHYSWADTVLVVLRGWPGLQWTVPSKLYEALALGLHVSGSIDGEAAEIITQTRAGFAVPAEDPAALAQAWVELAHQPRRPEPLLTRQWLAQHATEELASARYLAALTRLVRKQESERGRRHWQPGRRLRHLAAAARTVAAMAIDDPAWLTVQAGRRTPAAVRHTLGGWATRTAGGHLSAVWGELLLDRPDRARERLGLRARRGPFAGALGVHAGRPPGPEAGDNTRARWAWQVGDLEAARRLVRSGTLSPRLRAALAGDLEALQPGARPVPVHPPQPGRRVTTLPATPALDRPRVLHVLTNSLPWTRSGYTLRTHSVLTAQREAGVAVAGLTRPGYPVTIGRVVSTDLDRIGDIPYHRCLPGRLAPGEAGRIDRWAEHLVDLARAHRATHLHSTTHYPNALAAQAAAASLGLPWVHEVRGQLEQTWAAGRVRAGDPDPSHSSRFLAWRARETEVARAADHVVTISETMRADLIGRGVAADRLTVVPNGIDAALLARDSDPVQARSLVGLPTTGFWVGCLSSVVHYEGLGLLPEALALVRGRGLDVRCAVVGDGVAWPELARRVAELGLGDVFHLPGRLSRQESLRWLDALDTVLIPRTSHEVTRLVPPLKLVEAMGARRPVVVSDLPALTELVTHGETGLVTPPQDAEALADRIQDLAEDAGLRERLADAGREVAADRTWPALARTYLAAYASAGGLRAPGRKAS